MCVFLRQRTNDIPCVSRSERTVPADEQLSAKEPLYAVKRVCSGSQYHGRLANLNLKPVKPEESITLCYYV